MKKNVVFEKGFEVNFYLKYLGINGIICSVGRKNTRYNYYYARLHEESAYSVTGAHVRQTFNRIVYMILLNYWT